jgi:hypothetical protein
MVSSCATLTLPQLRARKVVFIPLLIPQPDWDKKCQRGVASRGPLPRPGLNVALAPVSFVDLKAALLAERDARARP